MILDVPYISFNDYSDKASSPAVIAATMIFKYHGMHYTVEDIESMFTDTILSEEFNRLYLDIRHEYDDKSDRSILCLKSIVDDVFGSISARLYATDIQKIHGSFTKRMIPVILTGKFPMLSGTIKNYIVVIGMEGNDLIVNDPMGNALTKYKDRNGSNIKYPIEFVTKYTSNGKPLLFITESI